MNNDPSREDLLHHKPAQTKVPLFLMGQGYRTDANEHFAAGLNVFR